MTFDDYEEEEKVLTVYILYFLLTLFLRHRLSKENNIAAFWKSIFSTHLIWRTFRSIAIYGL